ncbi:MAG: FtsL-like putative cell division protein [Bacteroidota bacterium]
MAKKKNSGSPLGINIPTLILSNIGFLSFLGVLAVIYIGNAHLAEYNVRRIQTLEREIREQRWLYMSLQSENMYRGLRSEVVERVRDEGLRLHRGKPKKIVVSPEELTPLEIPPPVR